jgi:hypothetical protein
MLVRSVRAWQNGDMIKLSTQADTVCQSADYSQAEEAQMRQYQDDFNADSYTTDLLVASIASDNLTDTKRLLGELKITAARETIEEMLTQAASCQSWNVLPFLFNHAQIDVDSLMVSWQAEHPREMDTLARAMADSHPEKVQAWLKKFGDEFLPHTQHYVQTRRRETDAHALGPDPSLIIGRRRARP